MDGHASALVALACSIIPQIMVAQQIPAPGTRVRVMDVVSRRPVATGAFVRLVGDTVVIATTADQVSVVALYSDRRWEVSAGLRRQTMPGIGTGFVVGALAGVVLVAVTYEEGGFLDPGPGAAAVAGAVALGVPGMVIGGVVGALVKRERWRPVVRPAPRLGIVPTRSHCAALAISLEF